MVSDTAAGKEAVFMDMARGSSSCIQSIGLDTDERATAAAFPSRGLLPDCQGRVGISMVEGSDSVPRLA